MKWNLQQHQLHRDPERYGRHQPTYHCRRTALTAQHYSLPITMAPRTHPGLVPIALSASAHPSYHARPSRSPWPPGHWKACPPPQDHYHHPWSRQISQLRLWPRSQGVSSSCWVATRMNGKSSATPSQKPLGRDTCAWWSAGHAAVILLERRTSGLRETGSVRWGNARWHAGCRKGHRWPWLEVSMAVCSLRFWSADSRWCKVVTVSLDGYLIRHWWHPEGQGGILVR